MAGFLAVGLAGLALAARERKREREAIDLRGQRVLITGGSRGLGLALAREFANQGARIALCARDGAELERAREDLRHWGVQAFTRSCDVADRAAVDALVADAMRELGGIDILVNNASIIQVGPIESLTLREFEDAMAVNFWGMVYATLAVLPEMRRRGQGRIVNITSIGGKVSVPRLLPYTAAKFAAVGFSEGLHTELAPHGIRVVTVVPGLMRTGSYLNAVFTGDADQESRWFALGSSLPLISMSAARAARQIVRAVRRGDTERILSVPATVLGRLHGLAPALTVELLTYANRLLLPRSVRSPVTVRAMELESRWPRWVRAATVLGQQAARHFHQRPGVLARGTQRRTA